jgi:hypothetical protein
VSTILDLSVDVVRGHARQYLVVVSVPCALFLLAVVSASRVFYTPSPVVQGLLLPVRLVLVVEGYRFISSAGVFYTWKLIHGSEVSVGGALKEMLRASPRLLVAYLGAVVKEFLYFLALIVPYFVALAQVSFVPHALLLEGRSVGDAVRSSRRLVQADAARVGWTLSFVFVLQLLAVLLLVRLPAGALMMEQTTPALAVWNPMSAAVGYGVQVLAIVLLTPLWAAASTLLFYDIMVTREGTDILTRIQAVQREYGLEPSGTEGLAAWRERE